MSCLHQSVWRLFYLESRQKAYNRVQRICYWLYFFTPIFRSSALFQHYAICFSKIFRNCLIAPLWEKTKTSVCTVLIYWSFAVGWQMNSLRGKIGYFGRTTPALSFFSYSVLGERNTHKSPSFNWGQSKKKMWSKSISPKFSKVSFIFGFMSVTYALLFYVAFEFSNSMCEIKIVLIEK